MPFGDQLVPITPSPPGQNLFDAAWQGQLEKVCALLPGRGVQTPEGVLAVTMGMLKASDNLVRILAVKSKENNTLMTLPQNESKGALVVIDQVSTLLLAGKMAGENYIRVKSETISVELAHNDRTHFTGQTTSCLVMIQSNDSYKVDVCYLYSNVLYLYIDPKLHPSVFL